MTWLLGGLLAAGLILCASPWLWPPSRDVRDREPRRRIADQLLREAGWSNVTARILLVSVLACAAVASAVAWLVTGLPAVVLVAACAGGIGPVVYLRARKRRLLALRRGLWPDVCDLLVGGVRVGMSLADAVAALADSAPAPLRGAFREFARDVHATGRFDQSVIRLKETLADPVADRIIETLRMARQVGGTELTVVLRALSSSVRADAALRAEVEARQSWIRAAAVLGAAAPWVILGMLSLRPEGASAYSSAEGAALIVGGAVVSVIAFRMMTRVGRLPEPRRWFR